LPPFRYTTGVVDSFQIPQNRHVGQVKFRVWFRARNQKLFRLESNQSSPRLAARDGMEQETLRVSIVIAIEIKRWGDVRSIPQARLPRFKKFCTGFLNAFFARSSVFLRMPPSQRKPVLL
jgi:hypothetical protein